MKSRVPRHIGIIPDGNRRWAAARGAERQDGYASGVGPGLRLYEACARRGIGEISVYAYTKENLKRPAEQVRAFKAATVELAGRLSAAGARLRVVGQLDGPHMPAALRRLHGLRGRLGAPRVNLLANYGWRWDVGGFASPAGRPRSHELPPVELVVRWGGGRRLSGFLPLQSAYADFFVVERLWPDYSDGDLDEALAWYGKQDRTLGG